LGGEDVMYETNPIQKLHDEKMHNDSQVRLFRNVEIFFVVIFSVLLLAAIVVDTSISGYCFIFGAAICALFVSICSSRQKEIKRDFTDWCTTTRFELLFNAWQAQAYVVFAPEAEKEKAIKESDIARDTFQTFSGAMRGLKEGDDDAWWA